MKPTVKISFLFLALFFLLFSMPGCGDDDGEDYPETFDSSDREVEDLPILGVDIREGESVVTAEDTFILTGVAYRATEVLVNGQNAELGEEVAEDLSSWEYEAQLQEGENVFEIKAVNAEGKQSEPLSAAVTMDPDYVPDPPENDVRFQFRAYFYWHQTKNYDPSGSRPDEMVCDIDNNNRNFYFSDTVSYSFSLDWSSSSGDTDFIGSYIWPGYTCHCSGTYQIQFDFDCWEEDDGFWTGGDDDVGTGSVTIDLPCCSAVGSSASTTIDGNTVEIEYTVTPK